LLPATKPRAAQLLTKIRRFEIANAGLLRRLDDIEDEEDAS
jgi:hypothetical protein